MRGLVRIGLAILAAIGLSSCLYLIHGSTQKIDVVSNPPGAIVALSDGQMGITPTSFRVRRADDLVFTFHRNGYEPMEVTDGAVARPVPSFSLPTGECGAGSGKVCALAFPVLLGAYLAEGVIDQKTGALCHHADEIRVVMDPLRPPSAPDESARQ